MNTFEINSSLRQFYPYFKGTYASNHLPIVYTINPPFGMVLNLDPFPEEGSHWTAIFADRDGCLEYFDSAGKPPPENSNLMYVINKYNGLKYNTKRLQSSCSTVCGEYCIFYLICRFMDISFNTFLNLFHYKNLLENDILVYNFVKEYISVLPKERTIPIFSLKCLQISKKLK